MIGALIGDIAGSRFEWRNCKSKDFTLLTEKCRPTDDSVMSLAIAKAILESDGDKSVLPAKAVACMQELGRRYPHAGYGGRFRSWIWEEDPQPYNSFGNGSGMRVSPCGYAATSLEEAIELADLVTAVTHDHPEGMKGAEAVAACIYLARAGKTKDQIRTYVLENFYDIDFTIDQIRSCYVFDVTCQGSVPVALQAFFDSQDFEGAIRTAISVGGDSDTIAAMTGSIAEAYYGVPEEIAKDATDHLDDFQKEILHRFEAKYPRP